MTVETVRSRPRLAPAPPAAGAAPRPQSWPTRGSGRFVAQCDGGSTMAMLLSDPFDALFQFQRALDSFRASGWLGPSPSGQ